MKKKVIHLMGLASVILLTGCTQYNEPISVEDKGIWNEFIVWPIVQIIHYLSELTGSYGGSIIAVTIVVRLVIFPLTLKQIKNSRKLQDIQPKLKLLQEQYNSKDAVTQQKYQQELVQLMQDSSVNPLGGCLPSIIQMPILVGLYHAISRMNVTPIYELGLFCTIPLVSPSVVLAIIAGIAQILVLKTGPSLNSNPQLAIVQYILPALIVGFGLISPAAIALYWIVSSLISVIQNIFIYNIIYKEKNESVTSK
ncbi:OxaA precursor [Bacillaceae bacterium SAS-127]|nr:OxaA precursor [Bacillaceae bacterium SAS-127]